MTNYQAPRWPAGIGALVCAGFVLFALFRDVRQLSDIGASQGGIIVAMTVAMLSGYYFAHTRTVLERILFGALFSVATFISVGLGGGRTNAMLEEKVSIAEHATTALADHKARLEELKADRDNARAKLPDLEHELHKAQAFYTSQCKKGPRNCTAAAPALETAQKSIVDQQARIAKLEKSYDALSEQVIDTKPTAKPNAELNSMTRLLALIVTRERAEELIRLIWPFLLATIGELGFIAFTHKLFEHRDPKPIIIPPATIKTPRRADPLATITVAQLASDMGVTPNRLRRFLNKELKMDRPDGGWKFTPPEAEAVAQRFTLANVKTPPTPAN